MIKKILVALVIFAASCSKAPAPTDKKPLVLVSIAPYQFLASRIGGDAIQVQTIVPPNANPHTFEPTSRQVTKMTEGNVWLRIGEPFEDKIAPFLKERNPNLITWDLRDGIELIAETSHSCQHCCKDHLDRHIWLSPKLAAKQAGDIEKILTSQWPEKETFFKENSTKLQTELLQLDAEIEALLKPLKDQTLLVSHPAFGYFCKEYGLKQLSVEYEGKDPRPRHLEKVMSEAKATQLKTALTIPQHNNKGTLLIAEKLGIQTKMIDPYSADYISTMHELAEMISQ
jgi:zinc transport system substrate-binding protein